MKIKVAFTVPSQDFLKHEQLLLSVESDFTEGAEYNQDAEWKVVIPDYIFDELKDTEPKFKTEYDINGPRSFGCFSSTTVTYKFKKTQVSTSISLLMTCFSEMTQVILNRHSLETTSQKKKIFIKFKEHESPTRYQLNHAYTGVENSLTFRFFIGFEMHVKKHVITNKDFETEEKLTKRYFTKIQFGMNGAKSYGHVIENFVEKEYLNLHLEDSDKIDSEFIVLDWTQERELFCQNIQDKFKELSQKLNLFFKNVDNQTIDELISNTSFIKLLTQ